MTAMQIGELIENLDQIKLAPEIYKYDSFNDEPHFYGYKTYLALSKKMTDGIMQRGIAGVGTSFLSPEDALSKSIYEAMERLNNFTYKKADLKYSSYDKNQDKFIDPVAFLCDVSTREKRLGWVEGVELLSGKKKFFPAQLTYLNYTLQKNETYLSYPHNSNGSAGGSTPTQATLHGIYELVERDCLITAYLNKISLPRVDLVSLHDKKIDEIMLLCQKYRLDFFVLDMTNDLGIPSYISFMNDHFGGPPIAFGCKSSLRSRDAIFGAILESLMIRMSIKRMIREGTIFGEHAKSGDLFADRARYWLFPGMASKLDFWTKNSGFAKSRDNFKGNLDHELEEVARRLTSRGFNIYVVDCTIPEFRKLNFFVHKTFIPGTQTLYLLESERSSAMDLGRLKQVASFFGKKFVKPNSVPHPFL